MTIKECKKGSQALNEVGQLREELTLLRMELIGLRGVVIIQSREIAELKGSKRDWHDELHQRVGACE